MANNRDNPMKRLQDEINLGPAIKKPAKSNQTFYINQTQYRVFRNYCRFKGVAPSEVLDRLISLYLEEVKNDLPPDPVPIKPEKG